MRGLVVLQPSNIIITHKSSRPQGLILSLLLIVFLLLFPFRLSLPLPFLCLSFFLSRFIFFPFRLSVSFPSTCFLHVSCSSQANTVLYSEFKIKKSHVCFPSLCPYLAHFSQSLFRISNTSSTNSKTQTPRFATQGRDLRLVEACWVEAG